MLLVFQIVVCYPTTLLQDHHLKNSVSKKICDRKILDYHSNICFPNMSKNLSAETNIADVLDLNQMIRLNESHHNRILKELTHVGGGYRSRTDDPLRARQML